MSDFPNDRPARGAQLSPIDLVPRISGDAMPKRIVRVGFLLALLAGLPPARIGFAETPAVRLSTPAPPPEWALLERALLQSCTAACEEFFDRYFDERGFLLCVERWGGDDGPDDAIENVNDWPILHALGAPDAILEKYRKAWEGHLRQYTLAKTREVPLARDGMYYKEFPVMFDWQHNGEGLSVFNLQGLSDVENRPFQGRVKRYAGFYMNEDPGAPNFDPRHRVIRSLFNGSRGPLLRKATALDWTGDPIEVEHRFRLGHGERNYQEMLAHFQEYNDIVGDHPLNLLATTLPTNAYMLTHDEKYKRWVLGYVDAWRERMAANNNIIPSNVGLDGRIGGECDGKWYGGTYGWAFSVIVPQTGKIEDRNRTYWGFIGFMNAYLLTGDDAYLEAWRKQTDAINARGKQVDGRLMTPRMHGDDGWYSFEEEDTTTTRARFTTSPCAPKTDRALPTIRGSRTSTARIRTIRPRRFALISNGCARGWKECAPTPPPPTRASPTIPCSSIPPPLLPCWS